MFAWRYWSVRDGMVLDRWGAFRVANGFESKIRHSVLYSKAPNYIAAFCMSQPWNRQRCTINYGALMT